MIWPALSPIYGRYVASLFKAATAGGVIIWAGTRGGRFALINMDDLADLYVRFVEFVHVLGGKIFV